MEEIWKDIPNYGGLYQVSTFGNVRSLDRVVNRSDGRLSNLKGKVLKQQINNYGYPQIKLCKDGKLKTTQIHKLVAIAYLNHTPDGHIIVVDHIDNNKLNNHVTNLQLLSNRLNCSKDKRGYSSKYIGVSWCNRTQKWCAYIKINNKTKFLGRFKSELDASKRYENELKLLTLMNGLDDLFNI